MKPIILSLLLCGCASSPAPTLPLLVQDGSQTYGHIASVTFDHLKLGDLVSYRVSGGIRYAKIVEVRGPGVFRVDAPGFVLVSRSNYLGQLFPIQP